MAAPINENTLRQLFAQGKFRKIAEVAKPAAKTFPANPVVMTILGFSFAQIGNLISAIHYFEKSVALNPRSAEAHNNLGKSLLDSGEGKRALECFDRAIALNNTYARAWFGKASVQTRLNMPREAIESYRKSLSFEPNNPKCLVALGEAHQSLGEFDDALEQFNKALALNPTYAEAHYSVAAVTKYQHADDDHIRVMQKQLNHPKAETGQKVFLNFGLGKAHADLKDHKTAFSHWQKANTLQSTVLGEKFSGHQEVFDRIPQLFSNLPQISPGEWEDKSPIFIIGMPRSGTSLVEQILSGHSKVEAAGELDYIGLGVNRYIWDKGDVTAAKMEATRNFYFKRVSELGITSPIFTDKMPTNFRWVGLIKAIFPKAKVIHLKRHPMAICFSNYRNFFPAAGMSYTYDQDDLARFYLCYDALMQHWYDTCGDIIIPVDYAALTEDPKRQTKDLLKKLGLDWEDDCLNIENNTRAVRTTSNTQIRGKIYSGSSEEWRNYQEFLKPMLKRLDPLLKDQGWSV